MAAPAPVNTGLRASQLQPGTLSEVRLPGHDPIALCNVKGEFFAVSGVCPHHGGPLGQGALNGHAISCPWHAWEFDCRTGLCDFNDTSVERYPVKVIDGELYVEL